MAFEDDLRKMLGDDNLDQLIDNLNEHIALHPDLSVVAVMYSEADGLFEVCGNEMPMPYAIGLLHTGAQTLMAEWLPNEE